MTEEKNHTNKNKLKLTPDQERQLINALERFSESLSPITSNFKSFQTLSTQLNTAISMELPKFEPPVSSNFKSLQTSLFDFMTDKKIQFKLLPSSRLSTETRMEPPKLEPPIFLTDLEHDLLNIDKNPETIELMETQKLKNLKIGLINDFDVQFFDREIFAPERIALKGSRKPCHLNLKKVAQLIDEETRKRSSFEKESAVEAPSKYQKPTLSWGGDKWQLHEIIKALHVSGHILSGSRPIQEKELLDVFQKIFPNESLNSSNVNYSLKKKFDQGNNYRNRMYLDQLGAEYLNHLKGELVSHRDNLDSKLP